MKVKVVHQKSQAVLVEYSLEGMLERVVVPLNVVTMLGDKAAECDVDELLRGIPFGIQWANYLSMDEVTPERMQNVLRNNGIWTAEDAERNPRAVFGAIQQAYSTSLADVLKAAKTARKEK